MHAGIRSDYQDTMKCPFPNKDLSSVIMTLVLGQIKNSLATANWKHRGPVCTGVNPLLT